jgi:hypothetical protein
MSTTPNFAKNLTALTGERRAARRYNIELDVRWKLVQRRKVKAEGLGRTIDLSSTGIRFSADQMLGVGKNVELAIFWPMLFNNATPMKLVVWGRTVRAEKNGIALKKLRHEFHTMGTRSAAPVASPDGRRQPHFVSAHTIQ